MTAGRDRHGRPLVYLAGVCVPDGVFLRLAWALKRSPRADLPMRTFRYSINDLALPFALLRVDHYLPFGF